MARRSIVVNGEHWDVYPSGRTTIYDKDQFGLEFEQGTGPERKRRFTRYAPLQSRTPDAALQQLTDLDLRNFFAQSQPAWTSPEGLYGAR